MTITVPSIPTPVPTSTDPTNFDERADALLAALPGVVDAQNLQNVENNTLNAAVVLQAAAAAADRVQTGLDRAAAALSKTGSATDKAATAEDRAQTALDRAAAALSKTGTGTDALATTADKIATAADRVQTGLDRTQTGLDRTAAALSKTGTASDLAQTALDRAAAALSKTGSAADVVVTGQDRTQTGQDRTQTGLDRAAANTSANTATTKADEAAASAASIAGGPVTSVADLTGAVSGAALKTSLSLDSVNNTSDANKPVSTATATALAGKQPSGSYPTGSGTVSGTNTGDQDLSGKQATLVSGSNIKTINGGSILGDGDIVISGGGASALTISNKTAAYTVVAADLGTVINCTSGTFTLTLTAASTLGTGFNVRLNNQGTGTITVATNGTNKIAGSTTSLVISAGAGYFIFSDGVDFFVNSVSPFGAAGVNGTQIGSNANGSNVGAAVGSNANGSNVGAAVGYSANGSSSGAAVGAYANGSSEGAAVGSNANGSNVGAAVGYSANGSSYGAAVGRSANGSSYGAAVGAYAGTNAKDKAVALGYYSTAQRYREMVKSADGASTTLHSWSMVNWYGSTTNATATEILLGGTASRYCVLLNNSAFMFSMQIIAGVTAGGDTSSWTITGAIKRGANAASTVLVGTPTVIMTGQDAGASGWAVEVTADTTNGSLELMVTGAASTTIRWNATATLSEIRN